MQSLLSKITIIDNNGVVPCVLKSGKYPNFKDILNSNLVTQINLDADFHPRTV